MQGKPRVRTPQQRLVRRHADNSDAPTFLNLLTGAALLVKVESVLPTHRERLFPPTETLSMFLSQALSADRACQKAVQAAYPQSRTQKPGLGFPLCRLLGLVCLDSGAVLNAAVGPSYKPT